MGAFGFKAYVVPTSSMEPAIHAGSLVVINENYKYDELKVGDIIVYERDTDNLLIIHRIIAITDGAIETQGDNNTISDGYRTTSSNYKGKEIFAIPKLGSFLQEETVGSEAHSKEETD